MLEIAKKEDIGNIIIGGDVAPNPYSILSLYKKFQVSYISRLMKLLEKYKGETNIFMMPGNDDVREVIDILNEAQDKGIIKQLHGNLHDLGKLKITGYSFIPTTPFHPNDWDKSDYEIQEDLKELPNADIYVFHAPPFGTKLDVMYNNEHIGSVSITSFIKQRQPKLTLHGHIHESLELTGAFMDRIKNTVCINPGASEKETNAALINAENVEATLICCQV